MYYKLIQGAAAGVTITQTSSIPGDAPDALVRGQNSINANSGPYIVVDGVPISKSGGTLNDINPNDIESMEILRMLRPLPFMVQTVRMVLF